MPEACEKPKDLGWLQTVHQQQQLTVVQFTGLGGRDHANLMSTA